MKMNVIAWLVAAVLSTCALAAPDASRLPPVVRSGFAAYKADGAQAAINAWMVGSPIAQTEQAQHEVHTLRHFESVFRTYQDFHVVRIVSISPTTEMIYLQLDYLNGPGFGKFLVYQAGDSWNVISFSFGDDPEVLWGFSLFGAQDML